MTKRGDHIVLFSNFNFQLQFRQPPADLNIDASALRTPMACRLRRLYNRFGLESVDELGLCVCLPARRSFVD